MLSEVLKKSGSFMKCSQHACEYFKENTIDSIRFIKLTAYEWREALGKVSISTSPILQSLNYFDSAAEIYECFTQARVFSSLTDKISEIQFSDLIAGDQEVVKEGFQLMSQALSVAATFGAKLKLIKNPTAELLEIAGIITASAMEIQKLYKLCKDGDLDRYNLTESAFELIKSTLLLTSKAVELVYGRYYILTCSTVIGASKIACYVASRNTTQ